MSAITAPLRRFFQRLERSQADSSSSEIAPAVPLPLSALGETAAVEAPAVALCPRCRHALRRNPHRVRAGRARARTAERDEQGRFRKN